MLDAVTQSPTVTIALAVLNVVQTVCLAYLAADRHTVNTLRKQGQLTRASDRPGSHPPGS
jgi:hypothetical protein